MSNYERINSERNIFLTKIFEPEENSLEFELTMGIVGELEKSHKILGVDIGPSRPVYHNENSEIFKITFDQYIAYSVINESYESLGGTEYVGEKIRTYKKSYFLDYVKADTFATSDYPGEFKHYAFITLNHIVNVVSTVEPKIEKIN